MNHQLCFTTYLGCSSLIAPSAIFRNFRFDENDFMFSQQDVALSKYIMSIGYTMAYVEDIRVKHINI